MRPRVCVCVRTHAQEYALRVIKGTSDAWKKLIAGKAEAKDIEMYERSAPDCVQ